MFICVILYIDRLRAPRARPLPPLHQSRPLRTSPRSGLGRHLCLRRSQAYGGALGCAVSRRAQGARGRRTAHGGGGEGDARRAGETLGARGRCTAASFLPERPGAAPAGSALPLVTPRAPGWSTECLGDMEVLTLWLLRGSASALWLDRLHHPHGWAWPAS